MRGAHVGMTRRSGLVALVGAALLAAGGPSRSHGGHHGGGMGKIRHFVVVYQENHSFDNLYGGWEGVDGVARADRAHTTPGQPGRRRRIGACCRTTST